ncbi:MAG TPA: hypothetical protein VH684_18365 [Xanthobacteraceae bacterium]|jgi:hypothetical protein
MQWIDFLESKPVTGLLVGAVSLITFGQIDHDWHAVALSLATVACYWFLFREQR